MSGVGYCGVLCAWVCYVFLARLGLFAHGFGVVLVVVW